MQAKIDLLTDSPPPKTLRSILLYMLGGKPWNGGISELSDDFLHFYNNLTANCNFSELVVHIIEKLQRKGAGAQDDGV